MVQETQHEYEFGPFHLSPAQRLLLQGSKKIALTPKAFQTLLVLVEAEGRVVRKDELLQKVWPDTFVEEATLAQNVFTLRRQLQGDNDEARYIETVPKRGYRFVGEVRRVPAPGQKPPETTALGTEPPAKVVNPPEGGSPELTPTPRSSFLVGNKIAIATASVLAILLFGSLAWWKLVHRADADAIHSLAVLPLEDLSHDPAQEYFADGLTEALITDLAKLGSVRVVSRTSVMRYKGIHKALPSIAQELGVDGVVEGTVLRSGDRVRITAQLVRVRNEQHLWAEMYDRSLGDALSVQGQIANAVAEQIRLRLSPKLHEQLSGSRPVDPEAYDLYLRGRYYWNKRDPEGLKKSLEFFQQAVTRDPQFALAYAGVADYYIAAVDYFPTTAEAFVPAREASLKALELDENLAEAHAALGFVRFQFEWDWPGAEKEFQRAIELSPNYDTAHHWYGEYLSAMGRCDESFREYRTALQSDPMALMIRTDLAAAYAWCNQIDAAVDELRRVLEMSPDFVRAHFYLAIGYLIKGMCSDAASEYQTALRMTGGTAERFVTSFEASVAVHCGKPEEARRILKELKAAAPKRPLDHYAVAAVEVALGDLDAAFSDLEIAEKQRSNLMVILNIDQSFEPLRSDSRFQKLLRRMRFVPVSSS